MTNINLFNIGYYNGNKQIWTSESCNLFDIKCNTTLGNSTSTVTVKPDLTCEKGIKLNGNIVINDGDNNDRAIKFQYNSSDLYAWRLFYKGSGIGTNNDFIIQTTCHDGTNTSFNDVLKLKTDKTATFSANVSAPSFTENGTTLSNKYAPISLGRNDTWVNTGTVTNMNDYTTAGVYNISGERTRYNDNLPINNTGGGHTFSGRLFVYDSSLPNVGNDSKDCCITQVLTLSNRVGGDGNMYIRTASGSTKSNLTWGRWGKLQTNIEVGEVYSLDEFIDNGIYSGIYTDGGSFVETFVMIVINDYFVAGNSKTIVQFKYAYDTYNNVTIIKHRKLKNDSWTDWESMSGGINEIPVATTTSVGGIKVANVRSTTPGITYGSTTTGRYYGVELDKNGKAFVNVPWSDTLTINNYPSNSFSSMLSPSKLHELTSTALTSINITGFNTVTGRVSEYGIMFNATANTTFAWPDSSSTYVVKWANGVQPCENGTKIGAGLWKILFTYTPGIKVYTATFARYS